MNTRNIKPDKTLKAIIEKEKHKHIWKYTPYGNFRTCEAPFPFIPSCGMEQTKIGRTWMTIETNIK